MENRAQTDLGNAERLADQFGNNLKVISRRDRWFIWDGTRWAHDKVNRVMELAKLTVRAIYNEAVEAGADSRAALAKHAARSESEAHLRAMISLAADTLPNLKVRQTNLDATPWLFNAQNGTVDLRTGELRPHDRENLITKICSVPYVRDAACPRWLAFLDQIFAGDVELIRFIQRAAGYSATGESGEQVFFLLVGAGKNGKSTFQSVLTQILGEYAMHASFDTFLASKFGHGSATFDLAGLAGARFIGAGEPATGSRWDEARLKSFTGGEPIRAAFKYENEFEYWPVGKLWFLANDPPAARDTGEAMRRRLLLVPFAVTIAQERRILDFAASLSNEHPGILAWIVDGSRQWYANGLKPPSCVRRASDQYLEDADTLGRFLRDCCHSDFGDRTLLTTAAAIHARYQAWCTEEGVKTVSKIALGRDLSKRGFLTRRSHGTTTYVGVALGAPIDTTGDSDAAGADGSCLFPEVSLHSHGGVFGKSRDRLHPNASLFPIEPHSEEEQRDNYERAEREGMQADGLIPFDREVEFVDWDKV